MYHYYVYYRIDPAHVLKADAAVRQMHFALEAELGMQGRLLKKRDEPALWMEIYENVASAAGFETALQQAVKQSGVMQCLAAGERRHVECFED